MIINNPIKLNDWEIKKFIKIILLIQSILLILISLEFYGIYIPIIRELIGFIYIAFLPGIIILRIFRLHKLSNTETLLYSLGLSLFISMFIGVFMSMVYPIIGIVTPLKFIPVIITMGMVIIILCIISFFIDKDFFEPEKININEYLNNKTLLLILIPFLSILGSFFINRYDNNMLTILLIVLICSIIFLVGFNKIQKKYYSFIILVISIALLFHNSLISNHINGFDIQREYFVANTILNNFKWEIVFPPNLIFFTDANSILSITTLPIMFYHFCGVSLVWIFKVVYPLLFSLVPIGLYHLFTKQTNNKVAFFSCIYFITSYSFFYNLMQMSRQIIGEIFLVAILILVFEKMIDNKKRSILLVIFLFSFAVSHYGIVFIFLAILIGAYVLQYIVNIFKKIETPRITINYVLLFIIFVLSWYIYNSHSSVFISIVRIMDSVTNNIVTDFLNPASAQGLDIIISKPTFLNNITKTLYLITQFFIIIGIFSYSLKFNKIIDDVKLDIEYYYLALMSVFILICSIALPNFSISLDTVRIIHITLIILSPFAIIGFIMALKGINKFINITSISNRIRNNSYKIMSIFFIIFLLFNVGLVQETFKEPYKPSMVFDSVNDPPVFNDMEIESAKWITQYSNITNSYIYGDTNSFVLLNGYVGEKSKQFSFSLDTMSLLETKNNSYIFLRTENLKGRFLVPQYRSLNPVKEDLLNKTYINNILINKNKIYDNGANIYN